MRIWIFLIRIQSRCLEFRFQFGYLPNSTQSAYIVKFNINQQNFSTKFINYQSEIKIKYSSKNLQYLSKLNYNEPDICPRVARGHKFLPHLQRRSGLRLRITYTYDTFFDGRTSGDMSVADNNGSYFLV